MVPVLLPGRSSVGCTQVDMFGPRQHLEKLVLLMHLQTLGRIGCVAKWVRGCKPSLSKLIEPQATRGLASIAFLFPATCLPFHRSNGATLPLRGVQERLWISGSFGRKQSSPKQLDKPFVLRSVPKCKTARNWSGNTSFARSPIAGRQVESKSFCTRMVRIGSSGSVAVNAWREPPFKVRSIVMWS